MATAVCLIREHPTFRRDPMIAGLQACGYRVVESMSPAPSSRDDLLVVWNRSAVADRSALRYEAIGAKVIVAENGYFGWSWRGGYWYALARNSHNGAGTWFEGGPERWDALNVEMAPWRHGGEEIVILAQRGIGQKGVAQPHGWVQEASRKLAGMTKRPVRVRLHPGRNDGVPLADDLAKAWACVTWSSGAALKAMLMGVPVFYGLPKWIGGPAALPFGSNIEQPFRGDRLPMFRRLAWAMWSTAEIATGEPFKCLLGSRSM